MKFSLEFRRHCGDILHNEALHLTLYLGRPFRHAAARHCCRMASQGKAQVSLALSFVIMKKLLVFIVFVVCSLCFGSAPGDYSELAEDLLFLVNPVSEDPQSFKGALLVCECALDRVFASSEAEKVERMSNIIKAFAERVERISAESGAVDAFKRSFGEEETWLLNELSLSIGVCEAKLNVRVQF